MAVMVLMSLSVMLSFSRLAALHHYYQAPFTLFTHLSRTDIPQLLTQHTPQDLLHPLTHGHPIPSPPPSTLTPDTVPIHVCMGDDWYRFPSHYFLPHPLPLPTTEDGLHPDDTTPSHVTVDLRFVRAGFHGQLPGYFSPHLGGMDQGMNAMNEEVMDRYVDPTACHYRVANLRGNPAAPADTTEPALPSDMALPPDMARPPETKGMGWTPVHCVPLLDAAASRFPFRALYVPLRAWWTQNTYTQLCLFQRAALQPHIQD